MKMTIVLTLIVVIVVGFVAVAVTQQKERVRADRHDDIMNDFRMTQAAIKRGDTIYLRQKEEEHKRQEKREEQERQQRLDAATQRTATASTVIAVVLVIVVGTGIVFLAMKARKKSFAKGRA